ncbi:MAG: hypothetical protein ACI8ZM_002240 [Crocinitomix sp.]|jgi:hypothetical protein
MKTGRFFISIIFIALIASCSKEKYFDGPAYLGDDFENISTVDELIDADGKWSFYQNSRDLNSISIDTTIVHTGNQSIKFTAEPSIDGASKSDIANNKLAFNEDETVIISAWFYLSGTESLDYIFLIDLEESIPIGAGPGLRFALEGPEGFLVVERNKFTESTLRQTTGSEVAFPRDQWVKVEIETYLQRKKKGTVKVWLNDQLIIDFSNVATMPKDKLFYLQGTKGIYNSLQVGITANSDENNAVLYLDDVEIKLK